MNVVHREEEYSKRERIQRGLEMSNDNFVEGFKLRFFAHPRRTRSE